MSKPLILIVDPDPDTRSILREYLVYRDYEVLEAADGNRGLELAGARRPDLIIGEFPLDVPGHSPFMRALREDVGCGAPVLTFTSRARSEEVEAAAAVTDAVVTKPATPHEVERAILRLLGTLR